MTGLNQSADCTPCSPGYYCGIVGQSTPTAYCAAGYYCKRSAEMSTPNQTTDANICPQGIVELKYSSLAVFFVSPAKA